MNQTLKRQLKKLVLETRLPWTKYLPLALLRITTAPQKDIGVSLYKMLYELPYLGRPSGLLSFEIKDQFLQNYALGLSSVLSSLRHQGLLVQAPPLEFPAHPHQAGDYILVKTWSREKLEPSWGGPYQVILTTETAVRTAGRGWTHYT
jgi:hypothetical protein